ncbi:DnaD domain protein [Planococcus sp. SIMBA_143]
MSKYRQVQVSFWTDAFVLDLTPEEKYFYVYLMTNSKSSQIGIYELPKRIIETETGYNRETVEKLLQRFVDYGKIEYHEPTKEIYIKNWAKYNWNNSPKVVARVQSELNEVKHEPFARKYWETAQKIKTDKVSIQYTRATYSPEILGRKDNKNNNEKDNDKDNEQQEGTEVVAGGSPGMAFRFYEDNIHPMTPHVAEVISKMIDESSEELVHESFRRAVVANAGNKLKFAEAILRAWHNKRLKTLGAVFADDKAFERSKNQGQSPSTQPSQPKPNDPYNYGV